MVLSVQDKEILIIERSIEKLVSVISSKFVLADNGEIKELHIVSNGSRPPKQISRDIQSILMATYDINIDYKKISIAELPDIDFKKRAQRLSIEKISYENKGQRISISVELSNSENTYETQMEGMNTTNHINRMVAQATLKTIEKAYNLEEIFILEDIKSVQLSSNSIIVVVVTYIIEGQQIPMVGSCIIDNDYKKSIVKAVLDAVNRSVTK